MKSLFKVVGSIFLLFIGIFIVMRYFDILTIEKIKDVLNSYKDVSPTTIFTIIILLLISDFFITLPTLALSIFAGFILGFPLGALCIFLGLSLSGLLGYILGNKLGESLIRFILKKEEKREELKSIFNEYGVLVVVFSRGIPMLPETSAALAGMSDMKLKTFILSWTVSALPYALITTYLGSIYNDESQTLAVILTIGIYLVLWSFGFYFFKIKGRSEEKE
jgi:uncharacterized membrane protein YdjX (TVP38/TMEM64 family)